MSIYPLTIAKYHLTHKGGTKDYTALVIGIAPMGRALMVICFGKIGAKNGTVQTQRFDNYDTAVSQMGKKVNEKERGGYYVQSSERKIANGVTDAALIASMRIWSQIGASDFDWLDGGDGTTFRDETEAERERREKAERKRQARLDYERQVALQEAEETRRQQEKNPIWGAF